MARQAASQPERKKGETESKHRQGWTRGNSETDTQTVMQIHHQHKPNKQTQSKQSKASQGHTNIQRQTENGAHGATDPARRGSM